MQSEGDVSGNVDIRSDEIVRVPKELDLGRDSSVSFAASLITAVLTSSSPAEKTRAALTLSMTVLRLTLRPKVAKT